MLQNCKAIRLFLLSFIIITFLKNARLRTTKLLNLHKYQNRAATGILICHKSYCGIFPRRQHLFSCLREIGIYKHFLLCYIAFIHKQKAFLQEGGIPMKDMHNTKALILREEPVEGFQKFVPSTVKLQWVSRELLPDGTPVTVRIPKGTSVTHGRLLGFHAAGRWYPGIKALTVKQIGNTTYYSDIYGRQVLNFNERFPCFDSYDYLYEDRYYRWFYLLTDGKLTEIYYRDDTQEVKVTDDVREVRVGHWRSIQTVWKLL